MVIARKGNQEVIIPLESYEVYYRDTGWTMVKDLAKEDEKENLKDGFNKEKEQETKPEMVEEKEDFRERSNKNNRRK